MSIKMLYNAIRMCCENKTEDIVVIIVVGGSNDDGNDSRINFLVKHGRPIAITVLTDYSSLFNIAVIHFSEKQTVVALVHSSLPYMVLYACMYHLR